MASSVRTPGPAAGAKPATAPAGTDCQATAAPPERAVTQAGSVRHITAALWAATLLAALAVLTLTLITWGEVGDLPCRGFRRSCPMPRKIPARGERGRGREVVARCDTGGCRWRLVRGG
jgi:hypothetical protein